MMDHCGFAEESRGDVLIILDKFDKIGAEGVRKELAEAGFPADAVSRYAELFDKLEAASDKLGSCIEVLGTSLPPEVAENLRTVIDGVTAISGGAVHFAFDPTLVRGMGYYTGTIFEIRAESFKGISIAGGGRYDKMIGRFTGSDVCACGFSIGFERMIGALMELGFTIPGKAEKIAVLYRRSFTSADVVALQRSCQVRRDRGEQVLIQMMNKNLGFQKKQLGDQGWRIIEVGSAEDIAKLPEL